MLIEPEEVVVAAARVTEVEDLMMSVAAEELVAAVRLGNPPAEIARVPTELELAAARVVLLTAEILTVADEVVVAELRLGEPPATRARVPADELEAGDNVT